MKRSEIPSLDDLRAFETVARLGSVRAAAPELALTHGAVSRRVSKLSADLGLRLLEAEGRGLRLTADGAKLAEAASQAFGLITDTLAEIRGLPHFVWRSDNWMGIIRALRSSAPARPYIARLIVFSRLI